MVGPLGPDQIRGNLRRSRPWRPGLLEALEALVQELVATWQVPGLPAVPSQGAKAAGDSVTCRGELVGRSCCWMWGLWQCNPSCRAGHPGPSCKGTAGFGVTRRGLIGDPLAVLGAN